MGSKKQTTKSTTNQTQTNAPPAWTLPGLTSTAGLVQNAIGQIPATHYSGDMVASMDPSQLAAIQQAWQGTAANAGDLAGWMQGQIGGFQPTYTTSLPDTSYNVADRQNLTDVINASIHPVQQQLMESILPSITNSALAAGAYSGDRAMGVLPQTAIRDATDSMQRIAAQLGYQDYNDYENRRLAAYQAETAAAQGNYGLENNRVGLNLQALMAEPEFVNSILHTQASQGDLLNMAAQLGVQNQQLGINNATAMDQYASQSPFMGLDTASELLARLSGNYGTQTLNGTQTQTTSTSGGLAGQLLQAALGAGMMAMGMPGGLGGIFGGGAAAAQPAAASNLFTMGW
jgi:hypothetical protein